MSWKDSINSYGKELTAEVGFIVGYETDDKPIVVTFKDEDIVSVKPNYNGALYSSVMKSLELEVLGKTPLKGLHIQNLKIGVKVGDGGYDYIDFGEYIVKESEYDVATKSMKCECYDKMLESMIPYDIELNYADPNNKITVGKYLQAICDRFEWELATPEFCNSTVVMDGEKFNDSYTFRDALDQIAQVAGGIIAFKTDGKLYVIYPTESNETIDESNLKDLTIGEKYGPVNSLILARTPQEDNIYAQDTASIEANGLCEVKIENNQIMDSHRDDFIHNLLDQIKGTTYYIYDLESFGIGYLNLGDMFTIKTEDGTEYKTIMLNDDLQVTQGMTEKLSVTMPNETQTDYSAASKTDRLINQTMMLVDKQNQEIKSLITKTENFSGTIESMGQVIGNMTKSLEQTMTAEAVETLISETVKAGTQEVTTTTGYKFDKDGLTISKSDKPMSTKIDEDGMDITNSGEVVLAADSTGVNALNLTARQYLIIGTNSRFEDYDNGTDSKRTGCFFIGG